MFRNLNCKAWKWNWNIEFLVHCLDRSNEFGIGTKFGFYESQIHKLNSVIDLENSKTNAIWNCNSNTYTHRHAPTVTLQHTRAHNLFISHKFSHRYIFFSHKYIHLTFFPLTHLHTFLSLTCTGTHFSLPHKHAHIFPLSHTHFTFFPFTHFFLSHKYTRIFFSLSLSLTQTNNFFY